MNQSTNFHYKNMEKKNKNFMYQNLKRGNCYGTTFEGSNFDYTSLRGTHIKGCDFYKCTFKYAEFVGANCKKSKFRDAHFEHTLFDSVNLAGADFRGATFKNVVFINTNVSEAVSLNLKDTGITVYEALPEIEMSEDLVAALEKAMENRHIKEARVLDTKDDGINTLSVKILLEHFDEPTLIKALRYAGKMMNKPFYVLSYLIKYIEREYVS